MFVPITEIETDCFSSIVHLHVTSFVRVLLINTQVTPPTSRCVRHIKGRSHMRILNGPKLNLNSFNKSCLHPDYCTQTAPM